MNSVPDVDDDTQALASMSCCPAGALVALGHVAFAALSRWWSSRRLRTNREREIALLTDIWNR
ncbi:hypothetical protein ACNHUS_02680 [Actinomycetes bacterium M1A6_2h]